MAGISSEELRKRYVELEQVLWQAWDKGYDEGLTPEFLLADMVDYVATQTELGRMETTIQTIWEAWKRNRGIE